MRYRLDYRPRCPQGKDEYFALHRDAGWEHACEYWSWHYSRSPVSNAAPELFSDPESRAAKYRSLLAVVGDSVRGERAGPAWGDRRTSRHGFRWLARWSWPFRSARRYCSPMRRSGSPCTSGASRRCGGAAELGSREFLTIRTRVASRGGTRDRRTGSDLTPASAPREANGRSACVSDSRTGTARSCRPRRSRDRRHRRCPRRRPASRRRPCRRSRRCV